MSRFVLPFQTALDANGDPLDGAKLYFYSTGTSELKDTFSDFALTTANANPVIANAQGEFPSIFLNGVYRVELKDKNDVTQPEYPVDNVETGASSYVSDLATLRTIDPASGQIISTNYRASLGDGGGGTFYADTSDLSTEVAADTQSGIYVAPSSDLTGASGAWVREYSDSLNVKWFGAIGDGVTDDITPISAAVSVAATNGGGRVFFPETGVSSGYLISSTITVSPLVELHGEGMSNTIILLSGDIDGITMGRNCGVSNLRIIAAAAATNAKACIVAGEISDTYNSFIRNVVVGGLSTSNGDATNDQRSAIGIQGGNTFWLMIDNVMAVNCDVGYQNTDDAFRGATLANNAVMFNQFKSVSNRVGCRMTQVNNVVMSQPSFTSSDEYGLVLGDVRTMNISGAHLESNHKTTNAAIKADIYISATAAGASTSGLSCTIESTRISGGVNSAYGIYIDNQAGVAIDGLHVKDVSTSAVLITSAAANSGDCSNYVFSGGLLADNSSWEFTFNKSELFSKLVSVAGLAWEQIATVPDGQYARLSIDQSPTTFARNWEGIFKSKDTNYLTSLAEISTSLIVSDPASAAAWATATAYTAGDFSTNGGNLYVAATTGTSGATAPVHTSGTVSDGGVDWTYISDVNTISFKNTSGSSRAYSWAVYKY